MGDLLKMFDGIVCICMDSEEDKWQSQCVPQFQKLGCLDRVIRYKSLKIENGSDIRKKYKGTTFAHYNAIKLCQEKNFKNPLILESDFWFVSMNYENEIERLVDDSNFIDKSFTDAKTKSWKMFSLGGLVRKLISIESDYLFRAWREHSHAYCINGDCYDDLLLTISKKLNKPIDWIYTKKKFGGDLRYYSYMSSKLLVVQQWGKLEKRRRRHARKMWRRRTRNFKPNKPEE
jgi:hypothetical protein